MKSILNKAPLFILCALALSPLFFFKPALQSALLIACSAVLIFTAPLKWSFPQKKEWPFIACFAILSFYFLLYFSNKSFKLIGDSFLLFIVPLFSKYLYTQPYYLKNKNKILIIYVLSVALLCLCVIIFFIADAPRHKYNWYLARYDLEHAVEMHGTYACLWVATAIIFLAHLVVSSSVIKTAYKLYAVMAFLLYLSVLLIYNSRNIMIGLFIIASIQLIRKRRYISKSLKIGFVLFAAIVFIISGRYITDLLALFNDSLYTSTRYIITSCSLQTIYDAHFMGIDHSLIQDKLTACYDSDDPDSFGKFIYNSHNQYLDFFLKGGIIMFIAFITLIFVKIKYTLKQKHYLYFSITILFAISLLTENVLIRQYGIYIYSFCDILLLGAVFSKSHTNNKVIDSQGGDKQGAAITHA